MTGAAALLAAVTLERVLELWLARRNTAALIGQGAYEVGAAHYPAIVLLHASSLAGLWSLGWDRPVHGFWLGAFLCLQFARGWVLWTLGRRWTTRIIVLPEEPLVDDGPYRFLQHPNYAVVVGEIAVLPLCFGLPWLAAVFSAANAVFLAIRIRVENTALLEAKHVS